MSIRKTSVPVYSHIVIMDLLILTWDGFKNEKNIVIVVIVTIVGV